MEIGGRSTQVSSQAAGNFNYSCNAICGWIEIIYIGVGLKLKRM